MSDESTLISYSAQDLAVPRSKTGKSRPLPPLFVIINRKTLEPVLLDGAKSSDAKANAGQSNSSDYDLPGFDGLEFAGCADRSDLQSVADRKELQQFVLQFADPAIAPAITTSTGGSGESGSKESGGNSKQPAYTTVSTHFWTPTAALVEHSVCDTGTGIGTGSHRPITSYLVSYEYPSGRVLGSIHLPKLSAITCFQSVFKNGGYALTESGEIIPFQFELPTSAQHPVKRDQMLKQPIAPFEIDLSDALRSGVDPSQSATLDLKSESKSLSASKAVDRIVSIHITPNNELLVLIDGGAITLYDVSSDAAHPTLLQTVVNPQVVVCSLSVSCERSVPRVVKASSSDAVIIGVASVSPQPSLLPRPPIDVTAATGTGTAMTASASPQFGATAAASVSSTGLNTEIRLYDLPHSDS